VARESNRQETAWQAQRRSPTVRACFDQAQHGDPQRKKITLVAVDDENAEGEDKMFYGVCQDSYWAPKNLIPVAVAREAVRYSVEHQRRGPALRWQQ